MPKVVVTGASGHIGYHVARVLLEAGFTPELLIRRLNPNVIELANRGARFHQVDLRQTSALAPYLKNADCLFHLAAENTTSTADAQRVLDSTVGLTEALLVAAVEARVRTVVYTSSVVVLGRSKSPSRLITESDRVEFPESPYVKGKALAEACCERIMRERGLDVRRVYPSWVVGPDDLRGTPGQKLISNFIRKPQRFYFSGGLSIAAAESVARAHLAAWLRGRPGGTYVLGGDNVTFRQFFGLLAELAKKPRPSIPVPRFALLTAAVVLKELLRPLGKPPPVDPAYARSVIGRYSWYDSNKAIRELEYQIPPSRESLAAAVLGERCRLAGTYALGKPRRLKQADGAASPDELAPLLITGVPGWLGNRFVHRILHGDDQGRKPPRRRVRLLVQPGNAELLDLPEPFEVVTGDIGDPAAVLKALEGIGTVFHLAGAIYPPRIEALYRVNADGTRNLIDQCIRARVRRVLFMGTDAICGHGSRHARIFDERTPDNPYRNYGRSKWMAERYVLDKTAEGLIDGTSLRGFWFFGPYGPPRQQGFLEMMRWPRQLVFGNGRNFRSISHVDNTISAFFAAENVPATYGKSYWIGDAKPDYTVDEIYALLCAGCGRPYRPIHVPGAVCALARALDTVLGRFGRLHTTLHGIGKFSFDIAGRIDAAQRDFGYAPIISLKEYAARAYSDDTLNCPPPARET